MKKFPVGIDTFDELRRVDGYYVDKTSFIKTVMEYDAKVLLITRPRRFGKSLFVDTVYRFLNINSKEPGDSQENARLFSGLKILNEKKFCDTYMGQFPVISISFKDVNDTSYETAYRLFAGMLTKIARQFSFLVDSPRLSEEQRELFARYKNLDYLKSFEHKDDLMAYLSNMVEMVSTHYARKVVVLLDEYDVPLDMAADNGYYEEMLSVIRGFLSSALKPDSTSAQYLEKAILTGCLRVSKESTFTGFNNPRVNTVCSENPSLAEAIGFTTSEVKEMLLYYGLESLSDTVKQCYDGYRFGESEIYCPWDVINFCADAVDSGLEKFKGPKNYWINTSGNKRIDEFLGFLSGEDTERMQTLLERGAIDISINEQLNYDDLKKHTPNDFWTILLYTGYLTIVERLPESSSSFKLRIPNEEVRATFKEKVLNRFSSGNAQFANHGKLIARALLAGETREIRLKLNELLQSYVSVRDTSTKAPAENFYHGFLSAVFISAKGIIDNFHSNAQAGDGYADIVFTSADEEVGVVIEIKHALKREGSLDLAKHAIEQIEEKRYASYFRDSDCKRIHAYGLVFFGKNCNIALKTIDITP